MGGGGIRGSAWGHSQSNFPRSQLPSLPQTQVPLWDPPGNSGYASPQGRLHLGSDSRPNAPRTSCSLVTEPSAAGRRTSPPWVPPTSKPSRIPIQPLKHAAPSQAQVRPLGPRSQQATPTLGLPVKATKDTSTMASTASFSCDPSLRSTERVGRRREEVEGGKKKIENKIADFQEPTATTTSRRKQTQNGRQPRSLSNSRQPPRRELGVSRDVRLALRWVEMSCCHFMGLSGAASPTAYT